MEAKTKKGRFYMKKKAFALMLAAVCVVTMCSGCSKGKQMIQK